MSEFRYRADVDGLRAVAVLVVLFYHAAIPGFSGGFVGVDVFFVISGFLITSLIVKDLNDDRFSIVTFYERRFRRILPAMFVAVVATALVAWFVLLPPDLKLFGKSLKSLASFYSNFFFWKETEDYFGQAAEMMPLLHTWSLAVEEQFYIVFPLLLLATHRLFRRHFLEVVVGVCVVSFGLRVWGDQYPASAFFLLHYRGWELMLGAILAVANGRGGGERIAVGWVVREVTGLCGLLAIGAAVLLYDVEPLAAALPVSMAFAAQFLASVGAFAVIWANGERETCAAKVLSLKPCVWIGLLSYSLYLWHWPALVFAKHGTADNAIGLPTAVGMLLVSLAGALLTYHFVEQPFRRKAIFAGRRSLFAASFVQLALIAAIGFAVKSGFPERFPPKAMELLNASRAEAGTDLQLEGRDWGRHLRQIGQPSAGPPDFLLWGDSHADMLSPVFDEAAKGYGLTGWLAYYHSNPPLQGVYVYKMGRRSDERKAFNDDVLRLIDERKIPVVVLAGFWAKHAPEGHYKGFNISSDPDESKKIFGAGFARTVETLSRKGVRVFVANDVPTYPFNVPRELARTVLHGRDLRAVSQSLDEHNAKLKFFNRTVLRPEVTVIDTVAPLCPDGRCMTSLNGRSLYADENHLSEYGLSLVKGALPPFFEEIGRARQDAKKGVK